MHVRMYAIASVAANGPVQEEYMIQLPISFCSMANVTLTLIEIWSARGTYVSNNNKNIKSLT